MASADLTMQVRVEVVRPVDPRSFCYGFVVGWAAALLFVLAVLR